MIAAVYLVFRVTVLGGLAPVRQHPDVSWPQAFLSAFALVGQHVAKLFWPHPLLVSYVFHKSIALSDSRVLAGVRVGVLAVSLFTFLLENTRDYSFCGILIAFAPAPGPNAPLIAPKVFSGR